jgi:hypothetical protein
MANYSTHVSVGAMSGIFTTGLCSVFLQNTNWDFFFMAACFGFIGGMIPDLDHDQSVAISNISALLSTMLPVIAISFLGSGRTDWIPWGFGIVLPCHYLLHFLLPRISWWGLHARFSIKSNILAVLVAAICAIPTLFILPRMPFGYLHTWLFMVGIALVIQLLIPIFKILTVHRGVFHSIPMTLLYAQCVYLVMWSLPFNERLVLAATAWVGALSHLLLDEIYSVDFNNKRFRTKRSFGSALKFWDARFPYSSSILYLLVSVGTIFCIFFI